jgi:predicted TIM-barrel fold metal-dependent hydrolase
VSLIEGIRVIDTDTHVSEPEDLWTSRISEKWGDLVPHVRWDEKLQADRWWWAGEPSQPLGLTAMAGWTDYMPSHPPRLSDAAEPGAYDPVARLELMDRCGIYAQVLYPNIAGFGSGKFLALGEPELMLACVQAYNDFLGEWVAIGGERFAPIMALPFWDIAATVREVDRCQELGHKGILFCGDPDRFGQPFLADPHWNPLWAVAQEAGLTINFHVGNSDDVGGIPNPNPFTGPQTQLIKDSVQMHFANSRHILEIITSGLCDRYPDLNFVSVESGIGWIPYFLESLDWQWANFGPSKEHPEFKLQKPSDYFHRQIYASFWFEKASARHALEILGPDNLLFETDFPHPTCQFPGPATIAVAPRDYIESALSGLPDATVRKILHENAARIYHIKES